MRRCGQFGIARQEETVAAVRYRRSIRGVLPISIGLASWSYAILQSGRRSFPYAPAVHLLLQLARTPSTNIGVRIVEAVQPVQDSYELECEPDTFTLLIFIIKNADDAHVIECIWHSVAIVIPPHFTAYLVPRPIAHCSGHPTRKIIIVLLVVTLGGAITSNVISGSFYVSWTVDERSILDEEII